MTTAANSIDEGPLSSPDGTLLKLHRLSAPAVEEQSPCLLVAHATGFCARMYEPLVQHAGLCSYGLDFRGHGESERPEDTTYPWERFGEDALVTARRLFERFGPLLAFGHSMGGASLLMAALEAPELFQKLYVYEPIVLPPELRASGESPMVAAAKRRRDLFPSAEAAFENFSEKPPLSDLDPEVLELYVRHGFRADSEGIRLQCRREDEAQIFSTSGIDAAWERLSDLEVPTIVAFGERLKTPGPHVWAPQIADRIPAGRREPFPTLGHLGPFENPGHVAASLRQQFGL